jgi:amino acid permease
VASFLLPSVGFLQHRKVLMGLAVASITPATLLESISSLRGTSFISVISILVLTVIVGYRSIDAGLDFKGTEMISTKPTIFVGMSVMSVSYLCHFNMLPVHTELKTPTRRRIFKIIFRTMSIATFLYLVVGWFGYLQFGDDVQGSILDNYPDDDALVTVARLGLAITLLLSYPLLTHPCRASIDRLVFPGWAPSPLRRILLTLGVVVSSFIGATVIPTIIVVWSFMGATVAVVIAFILPALFYIKIVKRGVWNADTQAIQASCLFGAGVLVMVICTWEAVLETMDGSSD